jgi:hypothetical protein
MARTSRRLEGYRSLGVLLALMAVLTVGLIASCGGGGGSSNGELCDQCGDDPDGPCQSTVLVDPNDSDSPECTRPKVTDEATGQCRVALACRRKVDSGQRRCYPLVVFGGDVDYQFRCDGSRPGGTPGPAPTPTLSPSPGPTSTAICGDGIVQGSEFCDSPSLNGQTCESQGCGGGILSCSVVCTFNFSSCTGLNCSSR